jgi:hypothetical protein
VVTSRTFRKLTEILHVKLSHPFLVTAIILLNSVAEAQTTFSSSNLPIVVINTGGRVIPDEPKVTVNMGIIYNGPGVINNLGDPRNHYNGKIGIELRGSSSQMFPKSQYGIELRDSNDEDVSQSLLGLPEEEDWILFAPYNDKSLMRDVLAYKLTRDMGHYASRFRYVELVIDSDYKGVYVLLEKIKHDKNRVDIADLDPDENSGDDLTGGYILKIDKTSGGGGGAGFVSAYPPPMRDGGQTIFFQYEYPKGDEITSAQKGYISGYMAQFETAMHGQNWLDPVEGYRKYVDLPSFIDYLITNEVSKNVDGYRLSTFLYKEKDSDGGKLHMGPVWDYNLGFGNANYCTNWEPSGFAKDFNKICPGDFWLIPFWWDHLWSDPGFRGPLYSRWLALRSGPLETSKVHSFIDSVANVLKANGASQRNFVRWPVLGNYVWPNPPDYASLTTYEQEVNWLKSWISQRMTWLDENLEFVISGVDDLPGEKLITVNAYPNPFDDELAFDYTLTRPGEVGIELYDGLGRTVERFEQLHSSAGTYSTTAHPVLAAGLYFYRVTVDGKLSAGGHLDKRK